MGKKKQDKTTVRDSKAGKIIEPIPMTFAAALTKALNTPLPKKEKKKK